VLTEGSGKVESGRIIIDPHGFKIYGTPGPGLESITSEFDSHADLADDELFAGVHNVIYRATSHAFREYQRAFEKHEKPRKEESLGGCKPASYLFIFTRAIFNISTSQGFES
jgi:hypothetical protein